MTPFFVYTGHEGPKDLVTCRQPDADEGFEGFPLIDESKGWVSRYGRREGGRFGGDWIRRRMCRHYSILLIWYGRTLFQNSIGMGAQFSHTNNTKQ